MSPIQVAVQCGPYRVLATATHPLARGARADVLLRPDTISVVEPTTSPRTLLAVVKDVSFRAGWHEHVVDLSGGECLTGIRSGERNERGRNIGLELQVTGCLALESRDALPSPDPAQPQGPQPAADGAQRGRARRPRSSSDSNLHLP